MAELLHGRYERIESLGSGGFGFVQKYRDTKKKVESSTPPSSGADSNGNGLPAATTPSPSSPTSRQELVAIKTISSKHVNTEHRRLVREIDIMAQLSNRHSRVVSILDVFATPAATFGGAGNVERFYAGEAEVQEGEEDHNRTTTTGNPTITPADAELTPKSHFDVHIVMPLMKGDLRLYSRKGGVPRDIPRRVELQKVVSVVFAFDIVFGVDYIHKCGIIHRDLKPENILIRLDTSNPFNSMAMIADFGLARDVSSTETFYVCTRNYRGPEAITGTTSGAAENLPALDIWSVGCILFEIVTGKFLVRLPTSRNENGQWVPARAAEQLEAVLSIVGTPSAEDVEQYMDGEKHGNVKSYLLRAQLRESRVPELIKAYWSLEGVSETEQGMWISLIASCLKYFPQQRPSASELCQHPLFSKYGILYGKNVHQYSQSTYSPVETFHEREKNKEQMLKLIADFKASDGKEGGKQGEEEGSSSGGDDDDDDDDEEEVVLQPVAATSGDDESQDQKRNIGDSDVPASPVRPAAMNIQQLSSCNERKHKKNSPALPLLQSGVECGGNNFPYEIVVDPSLRTKFGNAQRYQTSPDLQATIGEVLDEMAKLNNSSNSSKKGNEKEEEEGGMVEKEMMDQLQAVLAYLTSLVSQYSNIEVEGEEDESSFHAHSQ